VSDAQLLKLLEQVNEQTTTSRPTVRRFAGNGSFSFA
jgi:hypothetical protein